MQQCRYDLEKEVFEKIPLKGHCDKFGKNLLDFECDKLAVKLVDWQKQNFFAEIFVGSLC